MPPFSAFTPIRHRLRRFIDHVDIDFSPFSAAAAAISLLPIISFSLLPRFSTLNITSRFAFRLAAGIISSAFFRDALPSQRRQPFVTPFSPAPPYCFTPMIAAAAMLPPFLIFAISPAIAAEFSPRYAVCRHARQFTALAASDRHVSYFH